MKVLNRNLDIQLSPATILRVNNNIKHEAQTHKLLPAVSKKLQTDIVFQLKDSDKTLPLSVHDMELPLYHEQEVDIISANQFIIGFVDVKSEEYYYLTNDFCKAAGMQFFETLTWFAGIIASIMVLRMVGSMYAPVYAITILTLTWAINIITKEVFNRKIESAIDEHMQAFSLF
jgi:hypothetical protein